MAAGLGVAVLPSDTASRFSKLFDIKVTTWPRKRSSTWRSRSTFTSRIDTSAPSPTAVLQALRPAAPAPRITTLPGGSVETAGPGRRGLPGCVGPGVVAPGVTGAGVATAVPGWCGKLGDGFAPGVTKAAVGVSGRAGPGGGVGLPSGPAPVSDAV